MKTNTINEKLSIAPQFKLQDLQTISQLGFEVIICNRQDNEDADQPSFQSINQQVEELGITAIFSPMTQEGISESSLIAIYEAVKSDKKVLMYCRSGQRCSYALVYALAFHKIECSEILKELSKAGFQVNMS